MTAFADKADKGNGFSGRKARDSIKSFAKVSRPTLMSSRHKFSPAYPLKSERHTVRTNKTQETRGKLPRAWASRQAGDDFQPIRTANNSARSRHAPGSIKGSPTGGNLAKPSLMSFPFPSRRPFPPWTELQSYRDIPRDSGHDVRLLAKKRRERQLVYPALLSANYTEPLGRFTTSPVAQVSLEKDPSDECVGRASSR